MYKHIYLCIYSTQMKHIDPDKLFDLFAYDDCQVLNDNGIDNQSQDILTTFGGVIKGVENYYILDYLYTNRYGKTYVCVREKLQVKYFTNLVQSLKDIGNIPSDTVQAIIDEFGIPAIDYALNELVNCFIQIEQYDKCAIVHKFILKFNVNNLDTTQ